ncbi:MAG TPA: carboxypeptidase regulatory-like domain-containing protein [Pyrinomonadaceae bacterium]|nr:carboxypeptidase regulatory-like domain-containing protein [Pyrinomonadaceae bacterium]
MFRKYFSLTLMAALLMLAAITASAQTGELRGHVKLKQADGTSAPMAGAAIDVFRTDLKGKFETKTDKRGSFVFAGLPYVGTYIVGVSGPGAQPNFQQGVKAGRDVDYEIVLDPGDGRRLTLDEINGIIKGGSSSSSASKPAGTSSGESAADKAKRAEIEAKNKEIMEHNKKVEQANEIVARTFKLGNETLMAAGELTKTNKRDEAIAKYTEAITAYDEGLAADSEQPALLTNKALALKARGVDRYNAGITTKEPEAKTAKLNEAKGDFKLAAEATQKALTLLKTQGNEPGADPANQARANSNRLSALSANADAMRLYATKGDPTQGEAAAAAFEEYIAAETDPVKKTRAERDMARMLFDTNLYDKAKATYEKILAQNPDDTDALQNLGLVLYASGFIKESEGKKEEAKASYQEAANYLARFVDKAPDGQLKSEAQDVLKNLKEQQNVQAEKPAARPTRRKP